MLCQLCKKDRKLIEAHIIPRSFHRIDPEERQPSRLVTNLEGRYTQKIRKGIYDADVVCEECERRFTSWDDYANELFIDRWSEFEPIYHNGALLAYSFPKYDYLRLKMFFIALLWRASVSKHVMFSKVSTGPHEEFLRQSILSQQPGSLQFYAPVLQAFDSTNTGMLNPHPERFEGVNFQRFYVGHIIVRIKVDARNLPWGFDALSLQPNESLRLGSKDFLRSPERKIMQALVVADISKRSARHE